MGARETHTNIHTYAESYLMGEVNEAHKIPGLTGSGIRTTKAKTVNNLKNSRCTHFIKAEEEEGGGKGTQG